MQITITSTEGWSDFACLYDHFLNRKEFKENWNYDMQKGLSKANSLLKKTNPEEKSLVMQEDLLILWREIITFIFF